MDMRPPTGNMRTPLGRVLGLGSAKSGTEDFWRQRITAIIISQPPRDWTPRELAAMLAVHPRHMATQLREWSLLGWFTRTGKGTYRLNTPTAPPSSTTDPDP